MLYLNCLKYNKNQNSQMPNEIWLRFLCKSQEGAMATTN